MSHCKNVMLQCSKTCLSLCLSQGGFVWVSLIHFQSPRHHSMSRRPIMLLRKRTIFAIAFAGAFTGVSTMAGYGMTRAANPASR